MRRLWHPCPVSPVSRGRKPAKRRQPSRVHLSGKNRLREPGLQAARDLLIESLTVLLNQREVPGAYDAEVVISVLLGKLIQPRMSNSAVIGCLMDVIDELQRRGEDYSHPALRALAVLGPPELREYAASAADQAAGTADGDPPWVPGLGNVVPGKCLLATEPFGEQQVLSCEFSYADGTQPHSVWAVFDTAWHGAATTLVVTEELEKARRTLEKNVRKLDAELREIPAAEAAGMLLLGIEAFVEHGPPPGTDPLRDERYAEACAVVCMAHHRATVLLGPDGKVPAPGDAEARWPAAEREKLVAEFLASPQARNLRDGASRAMPGMLITSCVSQLGCEPDLIGPELLDRLLTWVIPGTILAPDHFGELIPPVIRAWTEWLAQRRGLGGNARKKLMSRLDALLRQFPARWNGPAASPLRRYVQDVPDDEAYRGDVILPLLERRTFAVPEPEDRPEGFSEARGAENAKKTRRNRDLDAAYPDDREVITMHDASARGVPVQRFGSYLTVVEQLWANDPPEVWEAAQRLQKARLSRGKIMDKLARAYDTSSPDVYPAALSRLRP
jgi:hypothetical protein